MEVHFTIIGILLIFLSLIHFGFPKKFNWALELTNLSLINRQIMQAHTFFIALIVFLNGLLFISLQKELTTPSPLSKAISFGLLLFWGIRCFAQHFFYSSLLWKGKKFETTVHILFSFFWIYILMVVGYNLFSFYQMEQ